MDDFKNFLNKIINKSDISESDYNEYSSNEPRNIISKNVNPFLDKYINPSIEQNLPFLEKLGINSNIHIPELSVAERKEFMNNMQNPENLATNMGIGSIKNTNIIKEILGKDLPNVVLNKLDTNKSKQIAEMFENLKHTPNDTETKASYEALGKEIGEQYDKFANAGFKFKKIEGENPYKTSKDLLEDIHKNKQLQYFPTEQGFGSSAASHIDNPMLQGSGKYLEGKELPNNDVFRIVHDLVGHGSNYNSFGPLGEEIGYQAHKMSLSPLAQKALTTETRGQNSWVNFGPHGESNRLNPANTIYADQKIGLLPEQALEGGSHKLVDIPGDNVRYKGLRALFNQDDEK